MCPPARESPDSPIVQFPHHLKRAVFRLAFGPVSTLACPFAAQHPPDPAVPDEPTPARFDQLEAASRAAVAPRRAQWRERCQTTLMSWHV
jgi:hypothetical protein